jgi:hypothetical protein
VSKARRLLVAIGGLGAVVLLGIAASFAIGGEQSKTDKAPRGAARRQGA